MLDKSWFKDVNWQIMQPCNIKLIHSKAVKYGLCTSLISKPAIIKSMLYKAWSLEWISQDKKIHIYLYTQRITSMRTATRASVIC